jgi:hypothetical protein
MTERRDYTITKFSLHKDGYLHCRITFEGTAYYCTEQHGSWMIPDGNGYKEILSPYKEEMAAKGRAFRKYIAKKKAEEALKKAQQEARISLDMGYEVPDIERALMGRYGLTKEVVCDMLHAATQLTTEDTNDGTTQS